MSPTPQKAMKTIGYIVTQGGYPCTIYNAPARPETKRGGVLLPATEDQPVEFFHAKRDASRAVRRTERVAKTLVGSLVDEWMRTLPLLSGKPYAIVPVGRQDGASGREA